MYKNCVSQEKENCHHNANKKVKNPHLRDFLWGSADKESSFSENESDETPNVQHRVGPIVDEVNKIVVHVHKKDKKHIGEEAFIPITLQVLKDTLNKRIAI